MKRQQGLSLIELMIAILISSILLLGVLQLFSNTSDSDRTNSAMARVQESGRIALEVIGADARRTGYQGCTSASTPATVNSIKFPTNALAAGDKTVTFRYATLADTGTRFGANKTCEIAPTQPKNLYFYSAAYTRCASGGVNRVCRSVNGATATVLLDNADITSVQIGVPSGGLMQWKDGASASATDLTNATGVRVTLTLTDTRNEISRSFTGTYELRNRL